MHDKTALILVTYNNYKVLMEALTSIYLHTNPSKYHLYVIDNNSTDQTKELQYEELINTTIIRTNENKYWAGGINLGLEHTKDYKYIFFLNDDIEVYHDWMDNHLNVLKSHPTIGAVGPLNSSLRDWQCYSRVKDKLYSGLPNVTDLNDIEYINNRISNNKKEFIRVKGMLAFFCTAFRREVIDQVGYLDERFIMGGDDDAYCRELEKHNYGLALLLNTYIKHKAGISIEKLDNDFKKEIKIKNMKLLKELYPYYYGN